MTLRRSVVLLLAILLVAATLWSSWGELYRLDYTKIPTRASWQLPTKVIEALDLAPGDRVADIGAGDGYFTFLLAAAVGAGGRVYAVEVDEHLAGNLERQAQVRDATNVDVVLGELDDPRLPNRAVDLVFLCNTYHHIDGRPAYFSGLRADLRPGGRVVIIDMKADLTGIARVFADAGHWTPRTDLYDEMELAGFRHQKSFDFLPVQLFEVFTVAE